MHIMTDTETLGTANNAVILSIGAVKFDPKQNLILDRFYSRICPRSCVDLGLVIDPETVLWWFKQSEDARKEFFDYLPPLKTVLAGFEQWIRKTGEAYVWGNGATFDNVIITSAYKAAGMQRPWPYTTDRCYRTIRGMFPHVPFVDHGTKHNALSDAEAQALHLMKIWPMIYSK